jgi:DNA N-6-adenine-methyltransferase (Dam)
MTPGGFTHERRTAKSSDEWYTPPAVFDALGLTFDLDPAAPPGGVPWVPAARHLSQREDGLSKPWHGRVWLNPPYGRATDRWLRKLADHGDGLALVFARTDTAWFQRVASEATALCFIGGRLRFHRPDGTAGDTAPSPSLLAAFGLPCALGLAESGLGQTFIPPLRKTAADA